MRPASSSTRLARQSVMGGFTFSRGREHGNDLGAEDLGAPAAHAVQRRERGRIAQAGEGDGGDQPIGQEQAGLEAESLRSVLAPLP